MAGKSALVIIDMENELLHPEGKLYGPGYPAEFAGVVANVQKLLGAARAKAVPVIFVYTAYHPSFVDASPRSPSRTSGSLIEGTWGVRIVDELAPQGREIRLRKRRPSAFYDTALDLHLRGLGAGSLFLCGTSTDRAVESTARDAFNRDYEVFVVEDGSAARSVAAHRASLASVGGFFAKVIDAAAAQQLWSQD